jgi:hypothetical protein
MVGAYAMAAHGFPRSTMDIDIITSVDGLKFNDAFAHSEVIDIEGISVHVLSVPDLLLNKRSTGRTKDMADVELLSGVTHESE